MPYPITTAEKNYLQSYKHQDIGMTIYLTEPAIVDGEEVTEFDIDESRVCQGGLVINRKSASGDALGFGACIASELSLILDNHDGYFDDVKFEGARIEAWLTFIAAPMQRYVSLGYFTVDGCPKKRSRIQLSALDDMCVLDRPIPSDLTGVFPRSASDLLDWIFTQTGMSYTATGLVNLARLISYTPPADEVITYRQLLSWVCQIVGANAFVDPDGEFQICWYGDADSAITLSTALRSDFQYEDFDVTITGVVYTAPDGTGYISGSDEYAISISGNPFVLDYPGTVVQSLGAKANAFTYRPFTTTLAPSPQLYPMDKITLSIGEESVTSVLTSMTFKINADTKVTSVGKSSTSAGYASLNPLTVRETEVIEKLKRDASGDVSGAVRRTLAFSELISNALGLFYTASEQPDGSVIYYMHDKGTLDESSIIFTMTANGIAWTNDWNGGQPIWTEGISKAGDAFFKHISASGLSLNRVDNPYRIEITPQTFEICYGETIIASISGNVTETDNNATAMQIPRILVTDYQSFGAIRAVPRSDGLDFVYVG